MSKENPNDFARGERIASTGKAKNAEQEIDSRGRPVSHVHPPRPTKKEGWINVTFKTPVGPYNSGEMAGFPPHEAELYIKRGQAFLTDTGHAPLNAAVVSSASKSEPAQREKLAKGAKEPKNDSSSADDLDELTYPQLRSLAALKAKETGVQPEAFDTETLKAYLRGE